MYLTMLLEHPLSYVAIRTLFLYLINPIIYVNWICIEGTQSTPDVMIICIGNLMNIHISLMDDLLL